VLAALGAVVAGCAPALPATSTAPATVAATPTADAGREAALGRLSDALGALATGYRFDTTVTVGGTVATHAVGRWVAGTSEFDVTTGGATITYRTVPPDAWVRGVGGTWTKLDGAPPGADPLAALRVPSAAAVATDDPGSGVSLELRYPASAFGQTGDDVAVTIQIAPDGAVDVRYEVTTGPATAQTSTRLVPDPGSTPLVAPTG